MMLFRSLMLVLTSLFASSPVFSTQSATICSLTDVEFVTAINTLHDWSKIHNFYKKYFPPCPDDGMFAEGYSELIVRTLAKDWHQLPELHVATAKDKRFRAFVLQHIDATTNETDLRVILKNSQSKCLPTHTLLCEEIAQATRAAIKELE